MGRKGGPHSDPRVHHLEKVEIQLEGTTATTRDRLTVNLDDDDALESCKLGCLYSEENKG